ncbi:MAG: endoglucanase [Actinocatenispora sp.]
MRLRRAAGLATGALLIATLLVMIMLFIAACGTARSTAPHLSPGRGAAERVELASTLRGGPVKPPAKGTLFGAYVGPKPADHASRLRAVARFERTIGRKLDVVHTYRNWGDSFGTGGDRDLLRTGATLLYSWAGTDPRRVTAGRYDAMIARSAKQIKAMKRPILLEWRWEMDRPNLRSQVHSAAAFVSAWKHLHGIFDRQHVSNASWVWCPSADGFSKEEGRRALPFYPGDAQVDWLCADAYPHRNMRRSFQETVTPFLAWARQHPKPIIIGEYGVPSVYGSTLRGTWLRAATRFIKAHPQIKAACYYESDPHKDVGNYSISNDRKALAAFRAMGRDRHFNP